MKIKLLTGLAALSLLVATQCGFAAGTNDAETELKGLVGRVKTKLEAGQKSEKDLAPELKQFDDLLAEHKGEKTDIVAQILMMKAMLYLQVLEDDAKGTEALKQLKRDFPDTRAGQAVDKILESIQKQAEARKIHSGLVAGQKFPGFSEKDVTGKPLSVDNFKGKVVLVDFWATWCGPCVGEMPNVIATFQKHHAKGFDIIGISLDQDKDKLTDFTKKKDMGWPQYFDGQGWGNKLAVKYGIESIPSNFLLDPEGKIIDKDLRGEALEQAVSKALAKK
jgi:thiol-disulfide isomerase/thioredoxin